jgi:hypothetical protein
MGRPLLVVAHDPTPVCDDLLGRMLNYGRPPFRYTLEQPSLQYQDRFCHPVLRPCE